MTERKGVNMPMFETIKYELVKRDGPIELRRYNDILLASTKTNMNQSQDSGFSNVFGYISGNNKSKQKISMTTPVVTYEEANQLITGFYVPSKFDKEHIPSPLNENVFINELKQSLYAVIKFRGRWTVKNFKKYDIRLKAYIEEKDYQIESPRLLFRYQPPFVPPIFRRNELAYKVVQK